MPLLTIIHKIVYRKRPAARWIHDVAVGIEAQDEAQQAEEV
jgi:hypothetical protein